MFLKRDLSYIVSHVPSLFDTLIENVTLGGGKLLVNISEAIGPRGQGHLRSKGHRFVCIVCIWKPCGALTKLGMWIA